MAFKDWFSRKSPFRLALERGTQPDGDLAEELLKLGEYKVKTQADAEAICDVLERVAHSDAKIGDDSNFHALTDLFQEVEDTDCPAFDVLADKGIGLLVKIVNDHLKDTSKHKPDDILFALKMLSMYGTPEGTEAVIRAARLPLRPDGYIWSIILQNYTAKHPQAERLFAELSDPLPSDFMAISLLDSANTAHRENVDWPHPFDSSAGVKQIERWLTDRDEENYSYAVSATAALPFLSDPNPLLALAFDHPCPDVQLEAAWVAGKLGREGGIDWLARACLDFKTSERAQRYLSELGREDAIPAQAQEPGFQAQAEFAQWLAHPSELGQSPDELEIVDHRDLKWPPDDTLKNLWLIKYRLKDKTGLGADDVGVGMIGSVTFCLFGYKLEQRPPEDCYAIHCYWEMSIHELIEENDVDENSHEYDHLLRQCKMDGLTEVRIVTVVEPASKLHYPQSLVALGQAKRHDQPGWIVIDGPRSHWYAASEMPADVSEKTVVMLHVGRVLLGFTDEPDRSAFLKNAPSLRTPEQVVAAYQALLDQARNDPKQAKKLLCRHSLLSTAFTDFVTALEKIHSVPTQVCICEAFEAILTIVENTVPSIRKEYKSRFDVLDDAFEPYVSSLIALERQDEVPALIEKFQPHWDHNLGYETLGTAAYKSGNDDLAESIIIKLLDSKDIWQRFEEIGYLAEIWKKKGRTEEAHSLLIDAIKRLQEESGSATGSDQKMYEKMFQTRRATYLELFPDRGEATLQSLGIKSSTMTDEAK